MNSLIIVWLLSMVWHTKLVKNVATLSSLEQNLEGVTPRPHPSGPWGWLSWTFSRPSDKKQKLFLFNIMVENY